jgi:hypothetical protein
MSVLLDNPEDERRRLVTLLRGVDPADRSLGFIGDDRLSRLC